jgi:SAM-dependent methyltransferase
MQAYEDTLVRPMFEPWASVLLDQLDVRAGQTLMDVATGPGTVARLAAARVGVPGRVTACDLSPAMLAIARAKPPLSGGPPIVYVRCPAAPLPAPSEAYDAVTCQQGLQFFPDRSLAVAEMHRVLRPGGRVGVAVWAAIEHCPPFAALEAAIRTVMGDEVADRFRGGPWGLSDGVQLACLFEAAGFRDLQVGERHLAVTFHEGPGQLWRWLPASGVAPDIDALDAEQRGALEATVAERMSCLVRDGQVDSEMVSNIAIAVK